MCLLGDNGAGKSTLIKTLSGVHKPDEGEIIVEGKKTVFDSPKDALDMGIATVYQDLALVSLMSVTRNFFMGREPQKGIPFFRGPRAPPGIPGGIPVARVGAMGVPGWVPWGSQGGPVGTHGTPRRTLGGPLGTHGTPPRGPGRTHGQTSLRHRDIVPRSAG